VVVTADEPDGASPPGDTGEAQNDATIAENDTSDSSEDGFASIDVRVAAVGQDLIRGTEFLHRKVSVEIAAIQNLHCMSSPSCRITGADWMKTFISHLLQVSHSQWIFRNYTLHDKQRGYLRLRLRAEVLREIHELLETPPSEVPPECQYLLELDHSAMYKASYEEQAYWVLPEGGSTGRQKGGNITTCAGSLPVYEIDS